MLAPEMDRSPDGASRLKINQLDAVTDDVIEAAASILVIGNSRDESITEHRR